LVSHPYIHSLFVSLGWFVFFGPILGELVVQAIMVTLAKFVDQPLILWAHLVLDHFVVAVVENLEHFFLTFL